MKTQQSQTTIIDDSFILPLLSTWGEFYDQVCDYSNKHLNIKQAKEINSKMLDLVNTLINFTSVQEDVVLKIAIVYYFEKLSNLVLKIAMSNYVRQNVNLLKQNDNLQDIQTIFNNQNRFLKNIIICDCILNMQNKNSSEYIKNSFKANKIISLYGKTIKSRVMSYLKNMVEIA